MLQRLKRLTTAKNRQLLVELIRADFKSDQYNSILGMFWSLSVPVIMLGIMYFMFKNTAFATAVPGYPLYLLTGIVFVNFFMAATSYMVGSLFSDRNILLNTAVPREVVLFSGFYVHLYKFLIQLFLCVVLSVLYGKFTVAHILPLVLFLCLYIAFVLGVGLYLAVLHFFASDVRHIWTIVSRVILFVTPTFYRVENLPLHLKRVLYWGNPLTPFLITFRGLIATDGSVNPAVYGYCLVLSLSVFLTGYFVFSKIDKAAIEIL